MQQLNGLTSQLTKDLRSQNVLIKPSSWCIILLESHLTCPLVFLHICGHEFKMQWKVQCLSLTLEGQWEAGCNKHGRTFGSTGKGFGFRFWITMMVFESFYNVHSYCRFAAKGTLVHDSDVEWRSIQRLFRNVLEEIMTISV